jgi:signal transduction histidine kinase
MAMSKILPPQIVLLIAFSTCFSQAVLMTDPKKLNDSARFYFEKSHFDKASEFAEMAKLYAERNNQIEELAASYLIMANAKYRGGNLGDSQPLYRKALSLAKQSANNSLIAKVHSNYASVLSQLGEYDSAENFLLQSIQDSTVDKMILISGYGRLGSNKKRQQQYASAIEFHLRSLTLSQQIKDSLASARTLANIGNIYLEQKEADRALEFYLRALTMLDSSQNALSYSGISLFVGNAYLILGNLNEAEKTLNSAMHIIRKRKFSGSEPEGLMFLASLKSKQGKTNEAILYYNEALKLFRKFNSWMSVEDVLIQLARLYTQISEHAKGKNALDEAKSIADKHQHSLGLQEIYLLKSKMDSIDGDFKAALASFQKSVYYKDTIFTLEKTKAIEELNKKFTAQQKEKIISEQRLTIEQQETKTIFLKTLIAILIFVGAIIYFFINLKRKLKQQMQQEQQRKRELLTIVVAQEQMQQKIARDLHDSLVQVLGAAKISLESLRASSYTPSHSNKIQEAADIIDQACVEARTISHQLLPYSLQKHGLVIALEELLEKNLKKMVRVVEFNHVEIQNRFIDTIEINVYRIIQELINNIIKHAHASKVQVQLSQHTDKLVVWVCDDGQGFNPNTVVKGAGLMNIESRLQLIRGTMQVESKTGEGTSTLINIPL